VNPLPHKNIAKAPVFRLRRSGKAHVDFHLALIDDSLVFAFDFCVKDFAEVPGAKTGVPILPIARSHLLVQKP
jgi:hypothetical protein